MIESTSPEPLPPSAADVEASVAAKAEAEIEMDRQLRAAMSVAARQVEPDRNAWSVNTGRLARRRRARVVTTSVVAAAAAVFAVVVVLAGGRPDAGGGTDSEVQQIRPADPGIVFPAPTETWTSGFQPIVTMFFTEYAVAGHEREVHLAVGTFSQDGTGWSHMAGDIDMPGAYWVCLFNRAAGDAYGLGQASGCRVIDLPSASQPVNELISIYAPRADGNGEQLMWFAITSPDVVQLDVYRPSTRTGAATNAVESFPARTLQPDRDVPARFYLAAMDANVLDVGYIALLKNGDAFGNPPHFPDGGPGVSFGSVSVGGR